MKGGCAVKKRIYLRLIFMLLVAVILTASISFAWFTLTERTEEIWIYSGNLRGKAEFYYVANEDDMGNPVLSNEIIPSEKEDWYLIDSEYRLKYFVPGQTHYFAVNLKNAGTIDGYLTVSIYVSLNAGTAENPETIPGFKLTYYNPMIEDEENRIQTIELNHGLNQLIFGYPLSGYPNQRNNTIHPNNKGLTLVFRIDSIDAGPNLGNQDGNLDIDFTYLVMTLDQVPPIG